MDEDLRAALFADEDEDGEGFEELDDDFVLQVMQEPIVPDFDFDAHIAALLARSEKQLVATNKARGWDDAEAKKLKKIRNKKSIHFDDDDDDDDDDEDNDDDDDDDSGLFDDIDPEDLLREGQEEAVDEFANQRRAFVDAQLEEALHDYDDAHIGDLEDVLDSDVEGEIDLDDLEHNVAFNSALDEFLQDEKDRVLARGTHVKKGSRNVLLLKKTDHGDEYFHEELYPVAQGPVDFKKESDEQARLQEECERKLKIMDDEALDIEKDMETCQEYLRDIKVVVSHWRWLCRYCSELH
jgi:hypothetical protein